MLNSVVDSKAPKGLPGTGVYAKARASGKRLNVYSNAKSLRIFEGFEYRDFETMMTAFGKQAAKEGWFLTV